MVTWTWLVHDFFVSPVLFFYLLGKLWTLNIVPSCTSRCVKLHFRELEYCAPVFHHALSAYLTKDIERIQKRELFIISPPMSYRECLDSLGLSTLYDRRNGLCRQLFDSIAINPGHKLYHLMPPRKQSSYNLRRQKLYNLPRSHTERFRRSFVYAMSQGCA